MIKLNSTRAIVFHQILPGPSLIRYIRQGLSTFIDETADENNLIVDSRNTKCFNLNQQIHKTLCKTACVVLTSFDFNLISS